MLKLLLFLTITQHYSVTRKMISWLMTVYKKKLYSQCSLTAQTFAITVKSDKVDCQRLVFLPVSRACTNKFYTMYFSTMYKYYLYTNVYYMHLFCFSSHVGNSLLVALTFYVCTWKLGKFLKFEKKDTYISYFGYNGVLI
jgi:hypothetical protein